MKRVQRAGGGRGWRREVVLNISFVQTVGLVDVARSFKRLKRLEIHPPFVTGSPIRFTSKRLTFPIPYGRCGFWLVQLDTKPFIRLDSDNNLIVLKPGLNGNNRAL